MHEKPRAGQVTDKAAELWEELSRPFQHLLNAVLWDGGRLGRYVTGPRGSGDEAWQFGLNFRDAVHAAEQGFLLAQDMENVRKSVVIVAALLKNVGKADAYVWHDGAYRLTVRGTRVGYGPTVLEWLGAARRTVIISEDEYLSLIHAIVAATRPTDAGKSIEASILCVAENLRSYAAT